MKRIGIIGLGGRGTVLAQCFGGRPDARVVAVCDPNPVRTGRICQRLQITPACFTQLDTMLTQASLDAVVVTTPDYLHEAHATTVLGHGLDVLVDKPLATTVRGAQNILDAAQRSGKTVMMGFNLRHDPTLRRVKEIVDQGVLGRIFLIENREFYDGGKTYMARWNRRFDYSGGLWIHKGSHDFDVFHWLLGFPRPVRVSATAGINALDAEHLPFTPDAGVPVGPTCHQCAYQQRCPDYWDAAQTGSEWDDQAMQIDHYARDLCIYTSDKDVHDNGIAIVEYQGGIRASHLECFVTSQTDRLYTIVGDRGQAEVSLHQRTILIRPRWSQETVLHQIPPLVGTHGGADTGTVDAFLKVLHGEISNTSTAEQGLWATAVGQAAEISARQGRMVKVSDLFESPAPMTPVLAGQSG
ncbi:MAG: Gfo/Idh/MocA family oxidoreductase [Phycisphaeraceae bacterium]